MTQREITSRIAYQLFEHRGYAHGRAGDDWFTAEAILQLCASRMPTAKPETDSGPRLLADTAGEVEALEVLREAVALQGRAAVAARLGYSSTASVGKMLRQDRALSQKQLERIRVAFAPVAQAA